MSDKIFAKKQIQFDEEAYNWKEIVSDTFCIKQSKNALKSYFEGSEIRQKK